MNRGGLARIPWRVGRSHGTERRCLATFRWRTAGQRQLLVQNCTCLESARSCYDKDRPSRAISSWRPNAQQDPETSFRAYWRAFSQAVENKNAEDIPGLYNSLTSLSTSNPELSIPNESILSLLRSIQVLVQAKDIYKSTSKKYLEVARTICQDFVPRWGLSITRGLLHAWMELFVAEKRVWDIEDMLNEMISTQNPIPNANSFNYVIYAHAQLKNWSKVDSWVEKMEAFDLKKTKSTNTMIAQSALAQKDYKKVIRTYEEIIEQGHGFSRRAYSAALTAAFALNDMQKADQIVANGNAALPENANDMDVVKESRAHGQGAALAKARHLIKQGQLVSPFVVDQVVSFLFSQGEFKKGRAMIDSLRDLGIQVDETTYQYLIHFLLGQNKIDEAMLVYHDSVENHLEPDGHALHCLINGLCNDTIKGPRTREAVDLFNQLLRLGQNDPDARIPQICLKILLSTISGKDLAVPLDLITEWKKLRRSPDVSAARLSSVMMDFCQSTPSSHNAFIMYDALRDFAPGVLDKLGYQTILRHFASRGNTSKKSATLQHLQYVFRDMQRDGVIPDKQLYLGLLNASKQSRDPAIVAWIDEQIRLDPHLDPETDVLTALMMAYGHTKIYSKCLSLYREMVASGVQLEPATVSVVLDNFGYGGMLKPAQEFWSKLRQMKFPLNKNHWDSYVECLARLGQHEEAAKIVLEEMGLEQNLNDKIPAADRETVKLLISLRSPDPKAFENLRTAFRQKSDLLERLLEEDIPHGEKR